MKFTIGGEKLDTEEINFINIVYIDETTMNVEINMIGGEIKKYVTEDEQLFERLDRFCDICSEK